LLFCSFALLLSCSLALLLSCSLFLDIYTHSPTHRTRTQGTYPSGGANSHRCTHAWVFQVLLAVVLAVLLRGQLQDHHIIQRITIHT
jgi:hypothetical protein